MKPKSYTKSLTASIWIFSLTLTVKLIKVNSKIKLKKLSKNDFYHLSFDSLPCHCNRGNHPKRTMFSGCKKCNLFFVLPLAIQIVCGTNWALLRSRKFFLLKSKYLHWSTSTDTETTFIWFTIPTHLLSVLIDLGISSTNSGTPVYF